MEKKTNKHNKKQLLIDNLYDYLQKNNTQELELKPQEFQNNVVKKDDFSLLNKQSDLEQYKKDYSSKIDKQLLIISQNIVNSLFGLNNEKFTAFMSRYDVWGFDLTMQQFIINFYLVVKTDNMLRQFVMSHMDKLIKIAKSVMEKYLITHMGEFRFRETRTDYNKKKVMDKIKETQKQIDQKMKEKDLNSQTAEISMPSSSSTSTSTATPVTTGTTTDEGEIPESEGEEGGEEGGEAIPEVQQFNTALNGENDVTNPQVYTMDQMMNMSDQELENLTNNNTNIEVPQIQNNIENLGTQPETTPQTETEPTGTEPEEQQEEQQSEEEQEMEQQILANVKRQHQNLQRGYTNNG